MYTKHHSFWMPIIMLSITLWNGDGAIFTLNGILTDSKWPFSTVKTVLRILLSSQPIMVSKIWPFISQMKWMSHWWVALKWIWNGYSVKNFLKKINFPLHWTSTEKYLESNNIYNKRLNICFIFLTYPTYLYSDQVFFYELCLFFNKIQMFGFIGSIFYFRYWTWKTFSVPFIFHCCQFLVFH